MKRRVYLILFMLPQVLFSKDNSAFKEAYLNLTVDYNWNVKVSNPIDLSTSQKTSSPYFLVQKKNNFITSVEYYNAKGDLSTFMFDPGYQIAFSKITLDYSKGKGKPKLRANKLTLRDKWDIATGYVKFYWDNKKIEGRDGNIRNVVLYKYAFNIPRGFVALEKRSFTFGGDALGDDIGWIRSYNPKTNQLMKETYYDGGNLVKELIYDQTGQIFITKFAQSEGKETTIAKILSRQNVVLPIVR